MIARSVQGKLLVFAIFFIGIATGVLSANLYRSRIVDAAKPSETRQPERNQSPQERAKQREERFNRFATDLGLDPTQREQVKQLFDETGAQFRALREKSDPEFKELRDKFDAQFKAIDTDSQGKIRAVLNEEQRKKYDESLAKRRSGGRGGRGGPRPPDRDSDKDKDPNKNKP